MYHCSNERRGLSPGYNIAIYVPGSSTLNLLGIDNGKKPANLMIFLLGGILGCVTEHRDMMSPLAKCWNDRTST